MSSALNQLGLLLAGRRPGFAGARTPAWNPAQPRPYPTDPNFNPDDNPSHRDPSVQDDGRPKEDKSFLRSVYDGLVTNPMGPAFTLAMANTLTAPLRPGQTETGKWVESITQGYNTMGALAQLREQQAAQARAEGREQAKVDQGWQDSNTRTQRVMDQGKEGEAKIEGDAAARAETERSNKATEAGNAEKRKNDLKIAEERAKVTLERYKNQALREQQRIEQLKEANKLKGQELGQQATYQGRMAGAAETNASANMKRATADALRAQTAAKGIKAGLNPDQIIRLMQLAESRAEQIANVAFLGGDEKTAEANLGKESDKVLSDFKRMVQNSGGQGTTSAPTSRRRYNPATGALEEVK